MRLNPFGNLTGISLSGIEGEITTSSPSYQFAGVATL